jgi:hypothetical protein
MDTNDGISGSKRQRRPSSIIKDHYVLNIDDINLQDDLVNFKEAVNSNDVDNWIEAMHEELDSIRKEDA